MAYVYLISNDINNKMYIGATITSIAERYSKHIYDTFNSADNSAIHHAIRKYGKEHFFVKQLEKCSIDNVFEREQYWIKFYNSYENGYNETIGGEGCPKYDYSLIYQKFKSGMLQKDIAKELGCEKHTITRALRAYDVSEEEMKKGKYGNAKKLVYKIDLNNNTILETYKSLTEAAKAEQCSVSMISMVCNNKRTLINKNYTYIKGEK